MLLQKLFGVRANNKPPSSHCHGPDLASPLEPEISSVLRIVHAGGVTEYHYMAVPAARILEKYPAFVLATPDVFWRPWDSVVRPDEILVPGRKLFIVPRRTLKKLRRRIRKPAGEDFSGYGYGYGGADGSFVSRLSGEAVSGPEEKVSGKLFSRQSKVTGRSKAGNRRVRFFGVDGMQETGSVVPMKDEKANYRENGTKKGFKVLGDGRKRRERNPVSWQPALPVVNETHGPNE